MQKVRDLQGHAGRASQGGGEGQLSGLLPLEFAQDAGTKDQHMQN